jgi:hypothetical protein
MNIPISSPIPQKSPSTPIDSRIKMNKLTRKIGAVLSVLLALSQPIVSANPAADAEAAYKESQKEWKSAQDAVTKFVDSGASTDPAITGLQSTFQEKKAIYHLIENFLNKYSMKELDIYIESPTDI